MRLHPQISARQVGDQILWLREAFNCENDKELSAALGIDATAISAWRRRGKVPDKYIIRAKAYKDLWITADRSILGDFNSLRAAYIFSIVGLAAMKIYAEMSFYQEPEYFDVWAGLKVAKLHKHVENEFRTKINSNINDELRALYDKFKEIVEGGDLFAIIDKLPEL